MKTLSLSVLVILTAAPAALAADPPSYSKQVRPFLTRYCSECHNAKEPQGGLNLESYASLMEGGQHGPVLVAGKADDSRIVGQVEGKRKPTMPPKKASRRPTPEEAVVLRAWVDAGAKDDGGSTVIVLPDIKPRTHAAAPVAALAYRPDGKLLAAAGWREVLLIDPTTGDVVGKLPGQAGDVTALAFSRDGSVLAVAAGLPGVVGEVRIYRAAAGAVPADPPAKTIAAHKDAILDLQFSPDGKTLATCGYDRLIKLWDVETGQLIRELKDHSDAVYGVAFSPDGTLLASGSADRAVKVWQVADGKRLYTLSDSTDWVYSVAWSPDGTSARRRRRGQKRSRMGSIGAGRQARPRRLRPRGAGGPRRLVRRRPNALFPERRPRRQGVGRGSHGGARRLPDAARGAAGAGGAAGPEADRHWPL